MTLGGAATIRLSFNPLKRSRNRGKLIRCLANSPPFGGVVVALVVV